MNLELREFSLSLVHPLETAAGTIDRREGIAIRIDDGTVQGVGEATPLPGWTEPLAECKEALERVRDHFANDADPKSGNGDDPNLDNGDDTKTGDGDDLKGALADSESEFAELVEPDAHPAARHGIALALLDLRARRASLPLYRYLHESAGGGTGRSQKNRIPVNATVGDGDKAETIAAASEAVRAGFPAIKCKVGKRSIAEDVARVRAVRRALDPDVELRVDANGAWSRTEARQAIGGLADVGVSYVEQPLPADDLEGHAELRGRGMDVALDESLVGRSTGGLNDVLDSADVLVLKPMALGGPDRAVSIARRARHSGVAVVVTTTVDAVVARTGAVHVAAAIGDPLACGLSTAGMLSEDIGTDPAPVRDGEIAVPQDAGLGTTGPWEECDG